MTRSMMNRAVSPALKLLCCSWILTSVSVVDGGNLLENGSFEEVRDGKPVHWTLKGDRGVQQRLSLAPGVTGGHAARLECTSFTRFTRDSYATLAQSGLIGID